MQQADVLIIGAGAAGLMCAIEAGKRGRSVLILDHANKAGKKILLSGGGRCNFTNRYTSPENYLSHNPHFCISALKRYTQYDFEAMVQKHNIPYHEKKLGQLFCDVSAKALLHMLIEEALQYKVKIQLNCVIERIEKQNEIFRLTTEEGLFAGEALVVASGGLSFPSMGASAFGYKIAEQFGLKLKPVRAALVPLTLSAEDLEKLGPLSGLSFPVAVRAGGQTFFEDMLLTHRGLSGPAILQISSYWQRGEILHIDLLPGQDAVTYLQEQQQLRPKIELKTLLATLFPTRFAETFCVHWLGGSKPIKQFNSKELHLLAQRLHDWQIQPNGTEGYRTAEVTFGGVDTDEISSKTFAAKKVPGLYFIGEVLDVTGHLGGFNFQWAWASGFCCGQAV